MVFPQTPLDLRTELQIAGTWTDVSGNVYTRDDINITTGQGDEGSRADPGSFTFTLNNRDGRYTPTNPMSPYYGQLGRNTPVRVSVPGPESYLNLTGDTAGGATTPDAVALDLVGDLDIRVEATADWLTTTPQFLIGKYTAPSQQSWYLIVLNGGLVLQWTANGTTTRTAFSDGIPKLGPRAAVRATLDVDNGASGVTATFYTSDSLDGTWTAFSTVTSGTTTSIFNSTAPLVIGISTGASATTISPIGRVHRAEVRNGINGTVVASPDFRAKTPGTTSFADSAGRTWSVVAPSDVSNREYLFNGELSALPTMWDVSGQDIWVPAQASGILRRMGQGRKPLDSTLRHKIPTDVNIQAYWPMEEGADATQASSPLPGVPPLRIDGVQWASADSLASSLPLPVISSQGGPLISMSGAVPTPKVATDSWRVQWVYRLDTAPTGGPWTFMRVVSTGTVREWFIQSRDNLSRVQGRDSDGNTVVDLSAPTGPDLFNQWLSVRFTAAQTGSTVTWRIDWIDVGGGPAGFGTSFTGTVGRVTAVASPQDGFAPALDGMAIGHIAVFSDSTLVDDAFGGALTAYQNDSAINRLNRLALENATPLSFADGDISRLSMRMGPQLPAELINLLYEAADSDGGVLLERTDRLGLMYRGRDDLENQTPVVTLDYTAGDVAPGLEPVYDDQTTRNDVTVTRANGSSGRVVIDEGPLSVLPPEEGGVGIYADSVTLSLAADDQAEQVAGWLAHLGTWDEARYPSVHMMLHARPGLIPAVLRLRIGDVIRITSTPVYAGIGPLNLMVRQIQHVLTPFTWDVTLVCTPAGPWFVGVADDPVLGRADTDGSQLAAAATATATTLSIATTAGPAWTTDFADYPMDLRVGGEVVTAVAPGVTLNANPSFDVSTAAWFATNGTLTRVFDTTRQSFVGRLTTAAGASPRYEATTVPVTAGQQYRAVGLAMAAQAGTNVGININWFTAAGAFLTTSVNSRNPATGVWEVWDATFTAPATAGQAAIHLVTNATAGLLVSGDEIRLIPATSVSTSSPQTMTVTRSVNGISKAQTAGTDIRLATPTIVAL